MLELIALPLIVLGLLAATVGGVRYAQHVRYQRCLANIARLEIELGYRTPPRRVTFTDGVSERWTAGVRGYDRRGWYAQAVGTNDRAAAVAKANRKFLVNAYKRDR